MTPRKACTRGKNLLSPPGGGGASRRGFYCLYYPAWPPGGSLALLPKSDLRSHRLSLVSRLTYLKAP